MDRLARWNASGLGLSTGLSTVGRRVVDSGANMPSETVFSPGLCPAASAGREPVVPPTYDAGQLSMVSHHDTDSRAITDGPVTAPA